MLMRALSPFRNWLPGQVVDVPTDQCRDLIIAGLVEPYTPDQLADLEPDELPPHPADQLPPDSQALADQFAASDNDGLPHAPEEHVVVEDGAALDAQAAAIFPDDDPGPTSESV